MYVKGLIWLNPILGEKIQKPSKTRLFTAVKKNRKKPLPIPPNFNTNNIQPYMRVRIHFGHNNVNRQFS
jgi:hypothetical protein